MQKKVILYKNRQKETAKLWGVGSNEVYAERFVEGNREWEKIGF